MRDGEGREKNVARGASVGSAGGVSVQAPVAAREPVEHVIHGDRRVDYYAWMRKKEDPRVKEYLEAENAYADAVMRGTEGFQEKLYQEMLGRIQQTDLSVPYRLRGYLYYTRTEEGRQYPIYCRRKANGDQRPATGEQPEEKPGAREEGYQISDRGYREEESLRSEPAKGAGSPVGMTEHGQKLGEKSGPLAALGRRELGGTVGGEGPEEVLLDLNELAVGHTYMGLGIFEVSDDNRLLAYATDTTGFRQYVLEVKRLGANEEVASDPSAALRASEWRVTSAEQERSPQGLKPRLHEDAMSELKLRPPKEGGR